MAPTEGPAAVAGSLKLSGHARHAWALREGMKAEIIEVNWQNVNSYLPVSLKDIKETRRKNVRKKPFKSFSFLDSSFNNQSCIWAIFQK